MKTQTDRMDQLQRIGVKLDTATDPEVMRFLITARKALMSAIEANRTAGPSDDSTER